jgi:short-subunit dehydrogenase
MSVSLRDKIVLITGSSSGIGRVAALKFAAAGAIPVLTARSVDKLLDVSAEIRERYGIEAPVLALDVRSNQQVEQVVSEVFDRFGHIDILVNNAGYGLFRDTVEISNEEIEDMMDVNYFGLVRMTKAVLPAMLQRREGHIINLASIASFFATPTHGAYAATKFAVQGFSEGLRFELHGTGVHLSTINPGPVDTPFFDRADRSTLPKAASFLSADQVADAVLRASRERKPVYILPRIGRLGLVLRHMFPSVYYRALARKQ